MTNLNRVVAIILVFFGARLIAFAYEKQMLLMA
jgi:hypothetical protein